MEQTDIQTVECHSLAFGSNKMICLKNICRKGERGGGWTFDSSDWLKKHDVGKSTLLLLHLFSCCCSSHFHLFIMTLFILSSYPFMSLFIPSSLRRASAFTDSVAKRAKRCSAANSKKMLSCCYGESSVCSP